MTKVPRVGRALDLAGLALFLGGALCYGYAWAGLRAIQGARTARGAPPGAIEEVDRLVVWSRTGATLMTLGIATGIIAALVAMRLARRARGRPADA